MNAITRHVKIPKLKPRTIIVPDWLVSYIGALKEVFYVIIVLFCWIFFLVTPWVPIVYIIARASEIPVHPVHNGGWLSLGVAFLSIFWYTFAWVIYKKHEQTRYKTRRSI